MLRANSLQLGNPERREMRSANRSVAVITQNTSLVGRIESKGMRLPFPPLPGCKRRGQMEAVTGEPGVVCPYLGSIMIQMRPLKNEGKDDSVSPPKERPVGEGLPGQEKLGEIHKYKW